MEGGSANQGLLKDWRRRFCPFARIKKKVGSPALSTEQELPGTLASRYCSVPTTGATAVVFGVPGAPLELTALAPTSPFGGEALRARLEGGRRCTLRGAIIGAF